MKNVNILHIEQFRHGSSPEDFYASTLENHLLTRHNDISLPHSHDFYLAIVFTRGTGLHEIDFTTYPVKPGALFFLNPGQTHHWELSADTEGFVFFHTQVFYNLHYTQNRLGQFPFYYSVHSTPCLLLEKKEHEKIINLFKVILEEYEGNNLLNKNKIITLTDLLYIEATRLYPSGIKGAAINQNSYYTFFRKFEELVEKHYRTKKSPAAYAALMNVSPKHLNRITQAVAGKTTSDVITARVLLEAKKMLVLQQGSFAQIAFSLGYDDYAYFSRLFKLKTGETPTGFLAKYGK